MIRYNGIKISDCGFFINLDKDIDRFTHIKNELRKNSIDGVEKFSGIINREIGRNGSKMSHIKIIEDFSKSNHNTCLIIEDDVEFTSYLNEENILKIVEKLNDDDVDAIWIGGCPQILIKQDDFFSFVISKSCAFGVIIKKSFCKKFLDFLNQTKKISSADAFYNRMTYGNLDNVQSVINIFKDENEKKEKIFDFILNRQYIFNYPIVVETNDMYSNNTSKRIKNGERKKSEDYIKGFISKIKNTKKIDELDNQSIIIKSLNVT
jgi:GR25 family glycosyltransferase involved in LPS biosynthesis